MSREQQVLITVESSLHITREIVTSLYNANDRIENVLDNFLSVVKAPGVGRIKYVLKDESGIILKNRQTISRAINLTEHPNRKLKLYLSIISDNHSAFSYFNWWIIVVICFIFSIMTSSLGIGFYLTNKPSPMMYGIVFDAGSVHTTMNVYKWSSHKKKGTGIVNEQFFCENSAQTGISSFKDNPRAVRDYIMNSDCMNKSIEAINGEIDNVVVFLGGTAGMRILNSTEPIASSQIMSNISYALKDKFKKSSTQILEGIQEGIYGWITVNYLSNVFGTSETKLINTNTIGALDWGGASSQITFQTNSTSIYSDHRKNTYLYGNNYTMYARSHLCYGQAEATRRYFVNLIYDNYIITGRIDYRLEAPCHHISQTPYIRLAGGLFFGPCSNITSNSTFQDLVSKISPDEPFAFVGTSNFTKCKHLIKDAFNPELCMERFGKHCFDSNQIPKPNPNGHYLAFSTYYFLLKRLHLRTDVTVKEFSRTVEDVCTSDYETLNVTAFPLSNDAKRNSCFNSCFMYKLLTGGYHFKNWTNIDFVRRVGDAEVGWTLGYMIEKTNEYPSINPIINVTFPVFLLIILCGLCFFILGLFFSYHSWHISKPSTKYERLGSIYIR